MTAGTALPQLLARLASRRPSGLGRRNLGSALRACAALTLLSLAACAVAPTQPEPVAQAASTDDSPAGNAQENLPDRDLDARTLYQLLIAEVLAQRGMSDAAFVAEFGLAKETRDPRIARRATEFALMAHQANSALQAANLWHDLSPESDEASGTLLTILVLSGQLGDAEPLLREVLAKASSKPIALAQTAATLSRSPNHEQALLVMQHLLALYPNIPEAHLAVAQLALGAGRGELALAEARTAARLSPATPGTAVLTAQYLQASAPAEAEAVLTGFLKHDAKSVEVRMGYARFLIGQKRYADASAQFEEILHARPHDTDTIYALGLLAYQADRPRDAEDYFKRFIALKAADDVASDADDEGTSDAPAGSRTISSAYLYLAQIAEDRKDYPEALANLGRISGGSDYVNARLRRAIILAHSGKLDQAREELHALSPRNEREGTQILLTEAQLLRDTDHSQAAFDLVQTALVEHPEDPDLIYDLGMTAEKLDRIDLMEEQMRKLIKLQPDNAQAYNALGYSLADRNIRLEEARDLIEKALSLAPDDASIIDSLGWVQYRLGNNAQAIESLQRAYGLRSDPEIAVHLGEVLWVSGRRADAEKYWREAGHKEPDNEVLRATLARLNVRIGSL
jgi:Flp pilus assembly protein TadD